MHALKPAKNNDNKFTENTQFKCLKKTNRIQRDRE